MASVDTKSTELVNTNDRYNNLKKYFDDHAHKFLERIGKGPPCEYRWISWKIISGVKYSRIKGLYLELLEEADLLDENDHDKLRQINLDLNRTFPEHPFFSDDQYGQIGQEKLKRALRAYAMYNKDVGYTQSINFLMGFFLMVNGGNDEEAFWLFVAITKKNQNFGMVGNFEGGLEGFYSDTFPLYHQFVYQFDRLFEKKLPKLKLHFDEIGYPAPVWLQKWFMTLFLYSFPMKLCIRLWDNLLVEGLTLIFKFPLAIMEILEKTLLKSNFEEVNDILSNLRTIDDPGIQPEQAILPNIERIINKARSIKLDAQELRNLKQEYEDMNKSIKRIKVLPRILEESDIYEEVERMNQKANSANGDDIPNDLQLDEDIKNEDLRSDRPNSADNFDIKLSSSRAAIYPMPLNLTSKSTKLVKPINDSMIQDIESYKNLPTLGDSYLMKEFDSEVLKKNSNEHSFDIGHNRLSQTPKIFGTVMHKAQKSSPLDSRLINSSKLMVNNPNTSRDESDSGKIFNKSDLNTLLNTKFNNKQKGGRKESWNDKLDKPLMTKNNGFSQSLGRFTSLRKPKHLQTECDIMEEINEEHDESLDNFLINNKFDRDCQSNVNIKFKRFETEHHQINSSFAKDNVVTNNLVNASYSNADHLNEASYQHANSDLFLESQNNDRNILNELYQPQNLDSDLLDYSDSSSLIEDSPAENHSNSNNKTHDTLKGTGEQDQVAHSISNK
jgi:hypothetical protein